MVGCFWFGLLLSVYVDVGSGFEGCFGIGLLALLRDLKEPPLSFQDRQPHVRSFGGWVEVY